MASRCSFPTLCLLLIAGVFPMSGNYQLQGLDINGAGVVGESANYRQEIAVGNTAVQGGSNTFWNFLGFIRSKEPAVTTIQLTNPTNSSVSLKMQLMPGTNAADVTYAIAISSDNFVTTYYVQSDGTIGPILGLEDYQSYTGWGGASGFTIVNLLPGKTYSAKVKAKQGITSETPYGPVITAATANTSISFDIDVSPLDTETGPPYAVPLGTLTPSVVTTANDRIWVDITSNTTFGATVYGAGFNGGLKSTAGSYIIPTQSSNLDTASEGYGLQMGTVTQSLGGPLTAVAPYNNSGNTVGIVDATIRPILSTSNAAITGGRASLLVKAKSSVVTPAGADYADTITLVAAPIY